MRSSLQPVTERLLADRTFDIEFAGFLTNHSKHAIVALHGLGAEPHRMQQYWDMYTRETPRELCLDKVAQDWAQVQPIQKSDWLPLRGQKIKWQEQVAFMDAELERLGSPDRLVAEYVDEALMDSVAGALTHGIIHLGWAIDAGSPSMICEAIAYLNFCHICVDPSKFRSQVHLEASPMDSWLRVADAFHEQDLASTWVRPTKAKYDESFHPEIVVAGFQWQVAKLLHEPHALATDLPSWVDGDDAPAMWQALYESAIYLYLASRNHNGLGNFVVLHLITSLWAIEQTCRVIENQKSKEHSTVVRRRACSQYYATVVVFLATSSAMPTAAKLRSVLEEFPLDDRDEEFMDWTPMVEAGKAEDEEHNIKLVYVTKELWNRYGRWKGYSAAAKAFTSTQIFS